MGNGHTPILEYDKPVAVSRCGDTSSLRAAAVEVFALRNVMKDDDVANDHVARSETGERLAAAEAALMAEFGRVPMGPIQNGHTRKHGKADQMHTGLPVLPHPSRVLHGTTPRR